MFSPSSPSPRMPLFAFIPCVFPATSSSAWCHHFLNLWHSFYFCPEPVTDWHILTAKELQINRITPKHKQGPIVQRWADKRHENEKQVKTAARWARQGRAVCHAAVRWLHCSIFLLFGVPLSCSCFLQCANDYHNLAMLQCMLCICSRRCPWQWHWRKDTRQMLQLMNAHMHKWRCRRSASASVSTIYFLLLSASARRLIVSGHHILLAESCVQTSRTTRPAEKSSSSRRNSQCHHRLHLHESS